MFEELIENPLFIISLVVIFVFLVGMIIAGSAHRIFYKIKDELMNVESSLNAQAYQVLAFGIDKFKQRTQLFLAGDKVEDCYDYVNDRIILKPEIFYGTSVGALAIASHEFGHSQQRYNNSIFFAICYFLQKLNRFFSGLFLPLVLLGTIVWIIPFELNIIGKVMIYVGLGALAITILMKLFLIPLEFGASRNGKKFLKKHVGIKRKELRQVKRLLRAAGFTYIASLFEGPYRVFRYIFGR